MEEGLRAKIISAYDNPDCLIGDTDFSLDEREEIRQSFLKIVERNEKYHNQSYSSDEIELFGILLFITAKRYQGQWGGKEFWFKIAQAISPDLDVGVIQDYKVLPLICDRLKKGGKCVFTFNGGTQTAYVETILYQAYAPRSSIEYFVRLAWSIYQSELIDYNYSESDFALCRKLIDVFARFYANLQAQDDLDLCGQKYGIRGGLRCAFTQDPDQTARILDRIFRNIDRIYHDNEEIVGSYLGDICNTSNFQATLVRGKHARKNSGCIQPASDLSHLKASYFLLGERRNAAPFICIPKTSLVGEPKIYEKEEVDLYIAKDGAYAPIGQTVESRVCNSFCGQVLREITIPLQPLYKELGDGIRLRVMVRLDGHLVYDSFERESLERDYLVFKANHNEIRTSCRPGEFYLFCPPDMDIRSCLHIEDYSCLGSGLYYCDAKEQDYINYLGNPLFFTDAKGDSSLFFDGGDSELIRGVSLFKKDNRYDFYHHPERLLIKPDPAANLSALSLEIDNEDEQGEIFRKPLSDLPLSNGLICLSLPDAGADTMGCHSIFIKKAVENGTKIQRELHYVIDEGCHFAVQPSISYTHGFLVLSGYVLGHEIQAGFAHQESTYEIPNGDTKIVFDLPYFKWAINDAPFETKPRDPHRPIFIDDLGSNNSLIRLDSSLSPLSVECGSFSLDKGPGENAFLLNRVLGFPGTQQALRCGPIEVMALFEEKRLPLFLITNTPYVLGLGNVFLEKDDGVSIDFSSAFVGRKTTEIQVKLTPEDNDSDPLVFSGKFAQSPSDSLPIPDGYYSIDVAYSYPTFFGSEEPRHIFRQENVLIGNPDKARFNGVKQLLIKKATHLCHFGGVYLTHIAYAHENDFGDPVYSGVIRQPAKPIPVEFTIRNLEHESGSIVIFKTPESNGVLLTVDKEKELLCDRPADGKTFFACSSFSVTVD